MLHFLFDLTHIFWWLFHLFSSIHLCLSVSLYHSSFLCLSFSSFPISLFFLYSNLFFSVNIFLFSSIMCSFIQIKQYLLPFTFFCVSPRNQLKFWFLNTKKMKRTNFTTKISFLCMNYSIFNSSNVYSSPMKQIPSKNKAKQNELE